MVDAHRCQSNNHDSSSSVLPFILFICCCWFCGPVDVRETCFSPCVPYHAAMPALCCTAQHTPLPNACAVIQHKTRGNKKGCVCYCFVWCAMQMCDDPERRVERQKQGTGASWRIGARTPGFSLVMHLPRRRRGACFGHDFPPASSSCMVAVRQTRSVWHPRQGINPRRGGVFASEQLCSRALSYVTKHMALQQCACVRSRVLIHQHVPGM